jgi:hypothetical protein
MSTKGSRGEKSAALPVALLPLSVVLAFAMLLFPGTSQRALAADESAVATIQMTPRSGALYREAPRAVNWRVESQITAPPSSPLILPMKRINTTFPEEMTFNPDPAMPVCPDEKVGPPPVNISLPPETIIARCPQSVLGNGTSVVHLAGTNGPGPWRLLDPVLVIFNGGRNTDGSPRIKVYGFSEALATGTYFEGTLKRNLLAVDIGQLPLDSAVASFNLNIPGSDSPFPERRGRDPAFVRATCADGSWESSASFTLGTRDSGGNPTGPDSVVMAPPVTVPCTGAIGKPRLVVKRAVPVRKGRAYAVTVENAGTASAAGYRLKVIRSGRDLIVRIDRLAPGRTATIRVATRSGRPGFRLLPPG